MVDEPPAEERRQVPRRDRLSILLIGGVALGGLLCMVIIVLVIAFRAG
ncbi:MAG TPA: hypothetical protein VGR16_15545 [Thermomicrobiales bacterium]|nr:hypothetical protein [Thermomicrobiales bacterium]